MNESINYDVLISEKKIKIEFAEFFPINLFLKKLLKNVKFWFCKEYSSVLHSFFIFKFSNSTNQIQETFWLDFLFLKKIFKNFEILLTHTHKGGLFLVFQTQEFFSKMASRLTLLRFFASSFVRSFVCSLFFPIERPFFKFFFLNSKTRHSRRMKKQTESAWSKQRTNDERKKSISKTIF